MNSDRYRRIAVVIGVIAVVAFNFISQAIPLGGATSAEIANRFPELLYFPANYAFSIWGLVYTFLIAFGVYHSLPNQRDNPVLRRISWLFVLTCIFNIAWLTCFHYRLFALSMGMMLMLLGTLLLIYIRLDVGIRPVSTGMRWCVQVPFSIYLGWISAATITNAAYVLKDAGWNGLGIADQTWAILMLIVSGILAVAIMIRRRDVAYSLVIIWAVGAIAVRHADIAPVQLTAIAVCVVISAIIVLGLAGRLPAGLRARAA